MPAHWHASRSRGRAFGRKPRAGASRFTWSGVSTLRRTSVVCVERIRDRKLPVPLRLGGRYEWIHAPREAQDGGVDARRRRERGPVEASGELDLVERAPVRALQRRRPDRGVFLGEAPLDDHVGTGDRPAEQAAQDRSRARERQVRDDGERPPSERCQSRASASTTETSPPNRARSPAASDASRSTATTRAPASSSARVSTPVPAPTSTTRSSRATPASRTRAAASLLLRRKCWPRALREERLRTATINRRGHAAHSSAAAAAISIVRVPLRSSHVLVSERTIRIITAPHERQRPTTPGACT